MPIPTERVVAEWFVLGLRPCRGDHPYASPLGIAWLAASAAVMFSLAFGKSVTGRALAHRVLSAEAKVTVADVAAGAVIVGSGGREGMHLLRQD